MRILLLLLLAFSYASGSLSSLTYELNCEEDSSGRIKEAGSATCSLSGDTGAFSGRFTSASYELNNGWYFTVNSDAVPPCAATGITSETLANGNIKLNWTGVVDNESFTRGYRIYRSVNQSDTGLRLSEAEGTEFTDTDGLIYGITYYYRIKPVDLGANESVNGNIVVSALSKSLSTSVPSLSAVSKAGGGIDLSWQNVPGILYYRIYRSEAFGTKGTQINSDGSTLSGSYFENLSNGLVDSKRYYYTVKGVDGYSNEQQIGNNQATALCDTVPPAIPIVGSSSHPDTLPSVDNCPKFYWVEAEDPKAPADGATGVKGYHYIFSRNSSESYSSSWSFKKTLTVCYENISDGDWYLFVLAEDNAGNKSAAASKKIVIKTTGVISGRVYDNDGKTPLKDTRLDILSGLLAVKSGRTDKEGNYTFSGVPFGEYKIKIFKAGFNPYESEVIALSKSITAVTFNKTINTVQNIGSEGLTSYPNPCRTGVVTFVYKVELPSKAVIDIYDSTGEKITAIEEDQTLAGFRETRWDASMLSSGVYFYSIKLENNGNVMKFPIKKLSLIR